MGAQRQGAVGCCKHTGRETRQAKMDSSRIICLTLSSLISRKGGLQYPTQIAEKRSSNPQKAITSLSSF
jgi:hypothetical protein